MAAGRKALSEEDKIKEIEKYEESYLASISEIKKSKWDTLSVDKRYERIVSFKRKLAEKQLLTPNIENIKSGLKGYIETLALNRYKSELLSIIDIIDEKIESNREIDEEQAEIERQKKEIEEKEKALKSKMK